MRLFDPALILAQSSDPSATFVSLLPRLAALIVVVAVLLFALSIVRRRMRADDGVARDFTLSDLRRLRSEGKLSDEELDRAKSALVGRTHATLAADAKPSVHARPIDAELKP